MHHDADEFRESPWPGLDLLGALERVDALGYSAIDFRVLNFRPTHDDFVPGADVRAAFPYYDAASPWDVLQVKAWKRGAAVDLVSSGGHQAAFQDRRICPIPLLVRHYPIRGQAHGERKVFAERRARFTQPELDRRWHIQYDSVAPGASFLRDAAELRAYDPVAVRADLLESHRDTAGREAAECRVVALEKQVGETRRRVTALEQELAHVRSALDAEREFSAWGPARALRRMRRVAARQPLAPGRRAAPVDWGTLATMSPLSHRWGFDRGTPVDRYYIERFLETHRRDVSGHVLEVKERWYTRRFGEARVSRSSVLDVNVENPEATVVADLACRAPIALDPVNCFILTQTLHIIFDIRAAAWRAVDLLAPGGVLLCTLPAVSRVSDEDGGLDSGDFWRLTAAAARRLFDGHPEVADLTVETRGNVRTCAAFLYGMAAEELEPGVLGTHDPWFPLIHAVRVVKRL